MTPEAIVLWTETSSDPELIAGVRAGDSAAFGVLYERHVGAARKVAAQYTNAVTDIDDVVSESFSRVLRALQRGDGPDLAFRAYLFTIVRRTGMDIINKSIRTKPRDDMSPYESAIGYEASSDEPALDSFEHGMVADAFKSLPERWQAVLWYTEVEKKSPKEIAPLLGLSANGVAALAYRAREALRQAYLQQHLNTSQSTECLEANAQLGAYVRGGLSKRENAKVDAHVQTCERCTALVAELADVNHGMRGIIAPMFMGLLGVGALEGGLPVGGALGTYGAGAGAGSASAGTSGATGASAGGAAGLGGSGVTGAAGVAGVAAAAGIAGKSSATTGIAGLFGAVSHVALPAAAVVGVTALAIGGASMLGWFAPDTEGNIAEGPEVADSPDNPVAPGQTADSDTAPVPPTDNSADAPAGDDDPATGDEAHPGAEDHSGAAGSGGTPSGTDGARAGQTGNTPGTGGSPGASEAPSTPGTSDDIPGNSSGTPGGAGNPGDLPGDANGPGDAPSPGNSPDPGETLDPGDSTLPGGDDGAGGDPAPGDGTGGDEVPGVPGGSPPPPPGPGPVPNPPPPAAAFTISKSALDYLEISRTAPQVSMTVENSGASTATDVAAQITLPEGLEIAPPATDGAGMALASADRIAAHLNFATDGTFDAGEWECGTNVSATVATCALDELKAGDTSTLTLPVKIVGDALADNAQTHFAVYAGTVTESYRVHTALAAPEGDGNPLDPGYVSTGGEAVAHFGATVMGCDPDPLPWTSCHTAMINTTTGSGQNLSNNDWNMVELKHDPAGPNRGVTQISLPEDVTVKAAYLEWSANRFVDPSQPHNPDRTDGWTSDLDTVQVKLDSGEFVAVVADEVDDSTVEENREYYLARADVTELLADLTSTEMTVADVAVASSRLDQAVRTYYGGFTVTIVYEDPDVRKDTRVALFEGPHWVKASAPVTISFNAHAGDRVTPSWTAYEGDRGNKGDRVSLGGDSFVPLAMLADGTIQRRDSGDAADSWANGSPWTNTLGIDANSFDTKVLSSDGRHVLRASTDGDNFMIGTLAVTITPSTATGDEDCRQAHQNCGNGQGPGR